RDDFDAKNGTQRRLRRNPMRPRSQATLARIGIPLRAVLSSLLLLCLCLPVFADRERTLLDSSWRFSFGDPPDVGTNVPYYPEIPDLTKLNTNEVTGANSETNLATLRTDPVATHLGETVSYVTTNYNDSSWRLL